MTFTNVQEVRKTLATYAIAKGVKLKIKPNETKRVRVVCVTNENCPFVIHISQIGDTAGPPVKTLKPKHDYFMKKKLYKKPKMARKDLKAIVEEQLRVRVSIAKCKRAKKEIRQELNGKVEFGYLEAYAAALRSSNPGTTAHIDMCTQSLRKGKKVFKRMFICFDACRRGWLAGCRPFIGLDGFFLKGVSKGILLSAVGKDGNDKMFPIAWAVVDKETKNN
ncbi:uncharacterized protein LOC126657135 [Mercurialis annua]|uniref:uncharacterized protein LOC126657135 n=1 Tax=Mercurialis annua TaxID=3986 RepID=UPI00215F9C74|nr:uncharacterized protein LOC126657135 [Mercurialis annua]